MDDDNLIKAKKTLQALDEALTAGPWNESSFIIMLCKQLHVIRDDLAAKITKYEEGETDTPEYIAHRAQLSASHKLVYISLYSLEGINIAAWERILANLRRQIVSRPVYANEEDAQNIIKTKEKKINEAYVSFYVNDTEIIQLSPDKVPMDKLGKPILVLKDNAIDLENIEYFFHLTGKYRYLHGRLVKVE
ncbi:MAG: Dot/Icm secretion system protein IcmQ [Legionellales bacterium]|nr:Dot/Icm secretion system protein IcmQ [Legionellales bacterium]